MLRFVGLEVDLVNLAVKCRMLNSGMYARTCRHECKHCFLLVGGCSCVFLLKTNSTTSPKVLLGGKAENQISNIFDLPPRSTIHIGIPLFESEFCNIETTPPPQVLARVLRLRSQKLSCAAKPLWKQTFGGQYDVACTLD